jgi:hypothetical protein
MHFCTPAECLLNSLVSDHSSVYSWNYPIAGQNFILHYWISIKCLGLSMFFYYVSFSFISTYSQKYAVCCISVKFELSIVHNEHCLLSDAIEALYQGWSTCCTWARGPQSILPVTKICVKTFVFFQKVHRYRQTTSETGYGCFSFSYSSHSFFMHLALGDHTMPARSSVNGIYDVIKVLKSLWLSFCSSVFIQLLSSWSFLFNSILDTTVTSQNNPLHGIIIDVMESHTTH